MHEPLVLRLSAVDDDSIEVLRSGWTRSNARLLTAKVFVTDLGP